MLASWREVLLLDELTAPLEAPPGGVDVITPARDGITIKVRVIPRAAKSGVAGVRDDALLVRLNAPPVEGAANDELVRVLSDLLGVSKRAVAIVGGARARSKIVRVTGIDVETCRSKLLASPRTS